MNTALRFILRDLKDNFIIIVTTTFIASPLLFYKKTQDNGFDVINLLGFLFFFFFTIYLSRIWNGVIGSSLSREYLLSLPISRVSMFWIMWLRSSVGFLPLFCLIWFSRAELRLQIFHQISVRTVDDLLFFIMLLGASWMFMMNLAVSQTTQSQMLLSRRKGKLVPLLKFFGRMALDATMILSWVLAFIGPVEFSHSVILGIISILYYALKNRIAYVQWMWGVDAKVFKV